VTGSAALRFPLWAMTDKTQCEHNRSAFGRIAPSADGSPLIVSDFVAPVHRELIGSALPCVAGIARLRQSLIDVRFAPASGGNEVISISTRCANNRPYHVYRTVPVPA
jgi:hypothetical protein